MCPADPTQPPRSPASRAPALVFDPRVYRAGLVPVLFALILAAFSLEDRPQPIQTTLAPDAFQAARAFADLTDMAAAFPRRRPGSVGDARLAARVKHALGDAGLPGGPRPFAVRSVRFTGETIDGRRELQNVIATRAGAPGPQIVVVAHRDAAAPGSEAGLSATAALVELGRVLAEGSVHRTITLVSTSGGSGGAAGVSELAGQLGGPVDAVLVLGDMASVRTRRPWVASYSNSLGVAPPKLTRTVQDALRSEAGSDPGAPRATTQWARLALPLTVGEQGELGRAGLPAVLMSASGEVPPRPRSAVGQSTLQTFGRAALRVVTALDTGPDLGGSPVAVVVTQRKLLPEWAVRLLVGSLLLAPLFVAVDAFARLRRRREPVGRRLAVTLARALPFLVASGFALALGRTGLLNAAPRAPVPGGAIPLDGTGRVALLSVALAFALGWLLLRSLGARLATAGVQTDGAACAGALLLVLVAVGVATWLVNPFAAALTVPALHLWLLVLAPRVRLRRGIALLVVAAGLLPFAALALADGRSLGLGPLGELWMALLLVAGGHVGIATLVLWSLFAAAATGVTAIALRRTPPSPPALVPPEIAVRAPLGYAGPGSLGGTRNALR